MTQDTHGVPHCIDLLRARLERTTDVIATDLRNLLAYWEDLRRGRDVPFRAAVDPRDMACDARDLFILEDLGEGNLRFRLAGSAITRAFGMDLRGMSARTLMDGRGADSLIALIQESLAEPGVGYGRLESAQAGDEVWEMLLLPLRSDFGRVDRILGGLVCLRPPALGRRRNALRLRLTEMTIRPLDRAAPGPTPGAPGSDDAFPYPPHTPHPAAVDRPEAPGFAEAQAGFAAPGEAGRGGPPAQRSARLVAIDGGRSGGRPSGQLGGQPSGQPSGQPGELPAGGQGTERPRGPRHLRLVDENADGSADEA